MVHVAVSSDGQIIAAVSSDTGAYVFTADGKLIWNRRPAAGEGFKSVAISSDGQYVVAGQDDEAAIGRAAVYLYAAQDGRELWNYETGGLVWSVATSSDGKYVAAGSYDHNLYFFIRASGTPLWSYEAKLGFKSVAISSDGQYIAAASEDGLYVFDRTSREPMWNYSQYGAFNTVAISSDGQYVVAGSSGDDSILLFKRDGAVLWRNPAGGDPLSVDISSDGQYVVAGSEGSTGRVSLFDLNNSPLWSHPLGKAVKSVAISSDGHYVAAGGDDRTVYIFRRETGARIFSYPIENTVFSTAFSSNGQSIAAGGAGAAFHFVMRMEYLVYPYFKLLMVIGASATAVMLIASANYLALRYRPSTRRWRLWLFVLPVAFVFLSMYLFAFDTVDPGQFLGLVSGSIFGAIGILAFVLKNGASRSRADLEAEGREMAHTKLSELFGGEEYGMLDESMYQHGPNFVYEGTAINPEGTEYRFVVRINRRTGKSNVSIDLVQGLRI